jgi:hypothetical protein
MANASLLLLAPLRLRLHEHLCATGNDSCHAIAKARLDLPGRCGPPYPVKKAQPRIFDL